MNADRDLLERAMLGPLPLAIDTSPMAQALSAQIIQAGSGEVRLRYVAGATFTQATGALQGGALATMLDFGLAFAALSLRRPDESTTTLSLTVNYLRPALPGVYEVHARVIRSGRRVTYAEATLMQPTNVIVATASSPLLNS